ncbi:hypothetical protein N0V93_002847 [Gnomoniopsis smithogilvyi]|uniref:Uncharacterized protein n=1 Tax=Gnomoniopsis smithogilvyi TaxID=1191159 RepID=A0A9W8YVI5_9PEZI|nr:hypothetical protein N0V93_002847 [Gnomoniopsis smithogilvyi]
MAPWLPRMHVFEFHDMPWFHPWFRAKVQAALTETWKMQLPLVQRLGSPASIVAKILADELGEHVSDYVFVDYCAGGGGPTPFIERYLNSPSNKQDGHGEADAAATTTTTTNGHTAGANGIVTRSKRKTNGEGDGGLQRKPVHFVLTDLHPHIPNWSLAAADSPQIHYAPRSIDASASPPDLLSTVEPPLPPSSSPAKTFRTFNLAFHHLPTPLASSVLADTLSTSSGFAIFELQDRHLKSFLAVCLLGLGVLAFAPYFAWRWRSPGTLFWCWVVPVLPFVLVWDGWMSSVRTRTVEEITEMMASCGAESELVKKWEVRSGRLTHLPPFAEVNWIVATKLENTS